jgi:hypothetical protein
VYERQPGIYILGYADETLCQKFREGSTGIDVRLQLYSLSQLKLFSGVKTEIDMVDILEMEKTDDACIVSLNPFSLVLSPLTFQYLSISSFSGVRADGSVTPGNFFSFFN